MMWLAALAPFCMACIYRPAMWWACEWGQDVASARVWAFVALGALAAGAWIVLALDATGRPPA